MLLALLPQPPAHSSQPPARPAAVALLFSARCADLLLRFRSSPVCSSALHTLMWRHPFLQSTPRSESAARSATPLTQISKSSMMLYAPPVPFVHCLLLQSLLETARNIGINCRQGTIQFASIRNRVSRVACALRFRCWIVSIGWHNSPECCSILILLRFPSFSMLDAIASARSRSPSSV